MTSPSEDDRAKLYADLHGRQMTRQEERNLHSARRILAMLFECVRPTSALDVGCGLGTWLQAAREAGLSDLRGIEGDWLDRTKLAVDSSLIETRDLEKPFSLDRKFDLVICLEVAEHLSPNTADSFVQSLVNHSDIVLFSAAIPFQGGHHHVNEQFLDYWIAKFAVHNFRPIDLFRPTIWADKTILWWLRQNMVLFAHDRALAANPKLREAQQSRATYAMVLPTLFQNRIELLNKALAEQTAILQQLAEGGTFEITCDESKTLDIRKIK